MKILLIDDDYSIRQSLKILLNNLDSTFELYSSADGVEGLGLMYVLTPDIVVVDTTLPKYSGKEILDFIVSNPKFNDKKVVVMHDGTTELSKINPNFVILDKRNRDSFLKQFQQAVGKTYNKNSMLAKIRFFFLKHTFRWANKSDLLIYNIHKETTSTFFAYLILWPVWIFSQLITSIGLTCLFIFGGKKGDDANTVQASEDSRAYRVRVYPTLIGLIVSILFILIQILLYIGGGIVIFNSVRLNSIFADTGSSVNLNFENAPTTILL